MLVVDDTTPVAQAEIIEYLADREPRGSRAGEMREELAVLVRSPDPRERYLFRDRYNLAFQLQEHWAYWAGANPGHVERYNSNMETWIDEDTGKMPGSAYGDRMRNTAGHDQIARAVAQLRESPETRRAMIVVHQPAVEDYDSNDIACTAYLHPFIRDGELHMVASLRSQDMYWGYPYDTANNQWIQETMAGLLNVDIGDYWHLMDSCHYYTDFEEQVLGVAESGRASAHPESAAVHGDLFDEVWRMLTHGLEVARGGDVPDIELNYLDGASPFHRDWLGVMTSYEQHRYHDDDLLAEDVARDYVGYDDWCNWCVEKAGGPL